MTAAQVAEMWDPVPVFVQQRYLNDPRFHAQVDRAVAGVMHLVKKAQL